MQAIRFRVLKHKYIVLFLLGGITNLGFAPYYLFFFPLISISALLLFLFKEERKIDYFLNGWIFGFGFFGFGLYWISNALLTDDSFFWLVPFAIILIPSILAIYIGLFSYICCQFKKSDPLIFVIISSIVWTIFEILRSYIFTGFPWLLFGYFYGLNSFMPQLASVVGVFGLSFIGFITSAIIFILVCSKGKKVSFFVLVVICLNIFMLIFGYLNLRQNEDFTTSQNIRIVQPNIQQFHNISLSQRLYYLNTLISLSTRDLPKNTGYIIWPELPLPLYLFNQDTINLLYETIPEEISVISNSIRLDNDSGEVFNSSVLLRKKRIIDYYDKSHLVPFGEYIPFRNILPMKKITEGTVDFAKGKGIKNIYNNNDVFGILICYESFFSSKIISTPKPDFLINLTNDAWYGKSQGPYLHDEMTRFRSIEENIPVYRAANNGISFCTNSHGIKENVLALDKKGFIDCKLYKAPKKISFYNKHKYSELLILIFILILLLIKYKGMKNDLSKK